ncbi:hypothetical protein CP500_017495 [Tychonema bourrellyi FEM_GT703]|uniref:Uncharacterized protein n=1 Tax=Tychonema bourrellyi FEM_GT703 TaxID=2040638 RepID=A0A2G4EXC4_9CYAN|nr:hypothetical protein CP500_017495 [Tychonema bourrellyi FEM_GT703]
MNRGAYDEDAELFSRSKSDIATAKAVNTFLIAETIDFIAFFLLPTSVFQLRFSLYSNPK